MSHTPLQSRGIVPATGSTADLEIIPCVPSSSDRYTRDLKRSQIPTFHNTVSPFKHATTVPDDLPDGWSLHIHPEGFRHFYHHTKRVVTPDDPRHADNELFLNAAAKQIAERSGRHNIAEAEIFLKVSQRAGEVHYYLVDFKLRSIFWVETVDTNDLGLGSFESEEALGMALTVEFWVHLEYFAPSQTRDEGAEAELVAILMHGEMDDSTSPTSTCPYSADECRRYAVIVQELGRAEDSFALQPGYQTATVARLWAAIARARLINSWGTDYARLDRLQGAGDFLQAQQSSNVLLAVGDAICFGASRHIFQRISLLWNGRIVYQRHWAVFLREMRAEWIRMAGLSVLLWFASNFLADSNNTTLPIKLASSISGTSTLLSLALHYRHTAERLATSGDISAYIVGVESVRHGLRPLSIIFALPRGLTLLAALLLQYGLVIGSSAHDTVILTLPVTCIGFLFVILGGLNVL